MFKQSHYIFFINIFNLVVSLAKSSTLCGDNNSHKIQKGNFATKTSYLNAFKDTTHWEEFKKQTVGCTPIKVWLLTRHGTRYPIRSDLESFENLPHLSEEILYNHVQGRGCLTEEDVFKFKRWLPPYEPRDKGQLHEAGADELYNIGEHWRDMFPDIFGDPYDSSKIKVEFTVRNRTGQSAYHFLRGMYGDDAIGRIRLPEPYTPNFILRFYKSCPVWLKEVYRNNKTYQERTLFTKTTVFQDMVRSVSSRLGYSSPMKLGDLIAIYDECRYETAWFPQRDSLWCIPFTQKDIEVLEYYQDLKYYYEDSYGIPLNKEIACRTVSDLYSHLKSKVISPESLPNGVLYFTHDKAIMKVQALLGLFSSEIPLKHDNFGYKDHKFKTSYAASFAANMGFVLYRCGQSHRVAMFYGGSPLSLPSICREIVCDWEEYQDFLKPIFTDCNLSKLCMLHDEL